MSAGKQTTNYELNADVFFILFFRPFHSFLMLIQEPSQAHNFYNTNKTEVKKTNLGKFQ